MAVMSLSALQKTGQFVSSDMFGANAVFSETSDGVPAVAYGAAVQAFGVQNIRFGGGQADLDPAKANAAGAVPIDGVNAINIVDMPGGELRTELVNFLDWCKARTDAGDPVKATLVIPTKHLDTTAYAAFAQEIETFVETVMQQYSDVIAAFQMGNEYWEMGETAYGIKASLGAVAIAKGLADAGIAEPDQPDILVQMATAGNQGSEFPAVPGVSDYLARNTAANNRIIEHLSDDARAAIDGVTEHYYYNRTTYDFLPAEAAVKNINRDYEVWASHFGSDLDLHITEWNVKTTAVAQHGIVAASSLIKQFENMIEIGVDGAHIWALDYHSRTALTLRTDNGVLLDDQERLTNSAQGAVFDLMSASLIDKELVSTSFDSAIEGIEVTSYTSAEEIVFYISSRSFEHTKFTLDLASRLPNFGPVEVVKIAIDPATSNGKQWERGVDADSVLIDGQPYFYNEHDVDVILSDMTFDDLSQIDLALNPFEVVELTVSLVPPAADPPDTTVKIDPSLAPVAPDAPAYTGSAENDQIELDQHFIHVDGGAGRDTLTIHAAYDGATITQDSNGDIVLSLPDHIGTVTLASIERLAFSDGTLAFDLDGHSGQAYRLYKASFDRAPDAEGLGFWVNQLDQNVSLAQAATAFLGSAEFQQTYGDNTSLSDAAFIELLYANVLDRTPDQAGLAYWREQQENDLSRADILVSFSESAENESNVAPIIDAGIWYS